MNIFQKVARKIIKISFNLSVCLIELFSNMKPYKEQIATLRKFKKGTLGKEIANCLDDHKLNLVPKYESHDLKHVLLNYEMTPEGEIRMQAFMIGNGNYSIPSFTILLFGAMLLPELWKTLHIDFQKGRNIIPIADWTIEAYAHKNLKDLQTQLCESSIDRKPFLGLQQITKFGAFMAIIAGVFGMLFCLPYLFSSNVADLVGAGFPFVGGAILAIGGLLVLSNLSQTNKEPVTISS